jgi:RimJ/RimL family protein N-acetyltransferase
MRKRVLLKSPVRENRTPGSVRGLSGNWQSYRDGAQSDAQSMLIQTNRLIIRSFQESDVPEYAAIVADPEVTRFLGDGSPHSYEQAAAYVHNCIRSEAKEGVARYAVILKETEELIGFCGFKKMCDYIDFGWRYAR